MGRCSSCGARLSRERPDCPEHGPRPASGEAIDRSIDVALPGYDIERLLGVGGFGRVFAARRVSDGAPVAIKVARADRPNTFDRFPREAEALAAIGPPHVPELLETGHLPDGLPFLVMELISAPTLADLLARPQAARLDDIGAQVLAILEALGAAHRHGFVHRDLKPENIFVDDEPRARLLDFGLVKLGRAGGATLTTDNAMIGSAEYMSPEQCEGSSVIDARSDIYAIGVILYELLVGRPPFWGDSARVRLSHASRRPPPLPESLRDPLAPLAAIIERCLAKQPRLRFASTEQLAAALRAALPDCPGELAIDRTRPAAPERARSPITPTGQRIAPRERRRFGIAFLLSDLGTAKIHSALAALGGQLVRVSEECTAAAFGQRAGESPLRQALRAAEALIERKLAVRALVDVAVVPVRQRPDGSMMLLGRVAPFDGRPPTLSDPPGVLITRRAAELMPELRGSPVEGRPGVMELEPPGAPRTSVPVDGPPLIGREPLLARLVDSARAAVDGATPTIAVVTGEAGHGKSHLAGELLERVRRAVPAAEVIDLRAHQPMGGDADRLLRELGRRALDLDASTDAEIGAERAIARLGPELARILWPPLALTMGWMAADDDQLRRLGAAPGVLRASAARAIGELVRRRAARRPLLCVIDDAHLADDASLDALEHAALADGEVPIWIGLFARPTLARARPGLGGRAKSRLDLVLDPLDDAGAAELCRRLLLPAEAVPASAIERLVARAQSVPLLLVELVRGLKRDGLVRRDGRGWYVATDEIDHLPDLPLVQWLAHREIDSMPPELAAHARLVALLGSRVAVEEVEGVVDKLAAEGVEHDFPLDAAVALRRLVAVGLLVAHRYGRHSFRHELLREAVAGHTGESFRRRVHRAAYAYYRDAEGMAEEERRAQIAAHAARAGIAEVAAEAFLALADGARERHAYLEAETLYSRCLEQLAPDQRGERQSAQRGRGLMRYRLGRYADALEDLGCARELAEEAGDPAAQAEILLDEATILDWTSDFQASRELVEEAAELTAALGSPALEARVLLGRGRSFNRASADADASLFLADAAALADAVGDEAYETLVVSLLMLGWVLQGLGRLDDAARALDRSIEESAERGDAMHLVAALNNRALLQACRGDLAGMQADFQRVSDMARELGLTVMELYAEYNRAETLYLMGRGEDAAAPIESARRIVEGRLAGAFRPVVPLLEARLAAHGGDLTRAAAIAAEIRRRRQDAAAELPFVSSEEVLFAMVELMVARAGPAAWDDLERRAEQFSVGQERIEFLEMRALADLRAGRMDGARAALDRALLLAASIPNVMSERLRASRSLVNPSESG
jgi:serine/threonine protein kinase/tetratricopeptide (TPR) repeat protein